MAAALSLSRRAGVFSAGDDGIVKLWRRCRLEAEDSPGGLLDTYCGHSAGVCSIACAWEEQPVLALSASKDRSGLLWRLGTAEPILRLENPRGGIMAVTAEWKQQKVVTGSSDGWIRCWDLSAAFALPDEDAPIVKTVEVPRAKCVGQAVGHASAVSCLTSNTDMKVVLSGGCDGFTQVWDAEHLRVLRRLDNGLDSLGIAPVTDLSAVWQSGQVATTSGDGALRCWDLSSGSLVSKSQAHRGAANCVDMYVDTKHVVTGSADGTIKVWDLSAGTTPVHTLWACQALHLQHQEVLSLVTDWSNGRILCGCCDGTLQLLDLARPDRALAWSAHSGQAVRCLSAIF